MGEYMAGRDLWKAFQLPGDPPAPIGVFENQPSPLSALVRTTWKMVAVFLTLLVALAVVVYATARDEPVFEDSYSYNTSGGGEGSFVTDVFELKGHTSNVELTTSADVNNNWIYLNYALINEETGHAYDFGR